VAFAEPLTDDEIERRARQGCAAVAAPLMPALHTASARRYSSTFMSLRSSDRICRPNRRPRGGTPEIQDRSVRTSRLIVSSVVPAILALSRVRGNRRPVFVLADPPAGLPLMHAENSALDIWLLILRSAYLFVIQLTGPDPRSSTGRRSGWVAVALGSREAPQNRTASLFTSPRPFSACFWVT
jgi:hypothetical protein